MSKLRENAKTVIGVGVKNSSSDLLIANCDEFIYYDDLVREDEQKRRAPRRSAAKPAAGERRRATRHGDKKQEAFDLMLETLEALIAERGDGREDLGLDDQAGAQAPQPGFNESYYGFRAFSDLLEEAQKRKASSSSSRDEKSGGYLVRPA